MLSWIVQTNFRMKLKFGLMFRVKFSIGCKDLHETEKDAEFWRRFIFWVKARIKSSINHKLDIMLRQIQETKSSTVVCQKGNPSTVFLSNNVQNAV